MALLNKSHMFGSNIHYKNPFSAWQISRHEIVDQIYLHKNGGRSGLSAYWAFEIFTSTSSLIQLTANDSWSFEMILVNAIGRNSSTLVQGTHFGIDVTQNSFQMVGKRTDLKDSLKIWVSDIAKNAMNTFRILQLGSFINRMFCWFSNLSICSLRIPS